MQIGNPDINQLFRKIRNGYWDKEESKVIEGEIVDNLLEKFVKEFEDYKLDFKQQLPGNLDNNGKLISAISNEGGGAIFIGIADDREILGLDNIDSNYERINRIVRDCCKPIPEIQSLKLINSKLEEVLVILIPEPKQSLVSFKDSYYKRIGDSTEKMTEEEIKERESMILNISKQFPVLWEDSARLTAIEILGQDRGLKQGGYREYYRDRDEDKQIDNLMKIIFDSKVNKSEFKHLMIIGNPLAGKSRLVFEWFKKQSNVDVLIPDINLDLGIKVPHNSKVSNNNVVFFDDLNLYLRNKHNISFLKYLITKKNHTIISTCRSGYVYENLKNLFLEEHNLDLDSLFTYIRINKVEAKIGKEIAKELEIQWKDVEFDGTIGSILLKLKEMKRRYKSECSKNAKFVLSALRHLYFAGLYLLNGFFSLKHIQKTCNSEIYELDLKKHELIEIISKLNSLEFIIFHNEEILIIELVYLERIVDLPKLFSIDKYNQITSIFSDNPEALVILANNMDQFSDSVTSEKIVAKTLVIENYKKILKLWTKDSNPKRNASVNRELGIIYSNLAIYTDKAINGKLADECLKLALDYYTEEDYPFDFYYIQYLLSIVYDMFASIQSPIDFANKALTRARIANKYFTEEKYPYIWALTLNTIGNAYLRLAEYDQAKLSEYCYKAIDVYEKALTIFNLINYPKKFAMIMNNISSAYGYLAKFEDYEKNSQLAIDALLKSLKVRTKTRYPIDFATNNNNLGTIYDTLAHFYDNNQEYEKAFENFEKAIQSYDEALSIRKEETLPVPYASTLTNLSITYLHYADTFHRRAHKDRDFLNELRKSKKKMGIDYIKEAIEGLTKAYTIFTRNEYPYKYSLIQTNLGNAYTSLAEQLIDSKENCIFAIHAYEKALEIRTIDEYPAEYGEICVNMGITYTMFAKVSDKAENCIKAFKSYYEALKVFNEKDFPAQYNLIWQNIWQTRDYCKHFITF